ncbi:MAG: L,D-transpeptidase family protein, partial [Hydrogenophaga sp.]|nr:L,D-transpeptidase family protein [Hydrogenophaga sp.]
PGKLEPGQTWAGLALLVERLRLLGDLTVDEPLPVVYEGVWVEAVQRFQERHGLAVDGVVGKDTWAALQVTPGERAQQIALNLERLRWTPLTEAPRMIVVNIPEFVLRAYEVREGRIAVHQTMKIIVGKAMDTRTPVFEEEMRSIEFSPYWNVPPSIAHSETVPKLLRDPGYLAREDMEFVRPDGLVSTEVTPDVLAEVLAGRARIRQRPGPKNALGAVKFSFPNRDHIYLHHTPAAQLFGKGRRDFSHGCVRVEQPVELALFVLQDMPQWTEQRVREAMAAGQLQAVRLATPVPVLITYGTALVKQGRLHFYPDIYGHDRELAEALRRR